MKKLLYSGLTALMMFLAMTGFVKAQHTFTFNPPSGSTVSVGDKITVTCDPAAEYEVVYAWFSSMEEAQAAEPNWQWDAYEGPLTVTAGNTVLVVAANDGTLASPVFSSKTYAQYTVSGGAVVATPNLIFPNLANNQYGMYVPFSAALTYGGEDVQNFEVYYSLETTPSKEAYTEDGDEIMRAVATEGSAEILLKVVMAPYFKAVAYTTVDGEEIASNMVELNLTALEVAKPEFLTAPGAVPVNTVVKIKDNTLTGAEDENGATILYSTDGETLPLQSAFYDDDDPNVFKYNDADGIVITEDVTLWVIAYKSSGDGFGIAPTGGSEMLRGRFTVAKPAVTVSLSTEEWTIGTDAPTVNVTVPEGVTLGTAEGNVAVKLYIYNDNPENGWEQIITANGTSLDMSKANEAGHEDFWTMTCSLVKGNATTETYEGDMEVTPEMMWLTIVKDGEKPAKPEFSVPSGEVPAGTQVTISCATDGATLYYTYGDAEVTMPYRQPIVINSDCSIRAMAEKDGMQSDIASATYKIKAEPLPAPTITLTPAPGEVAAGTELEIEVSVELGNNDIVGYKLYPTEDSANKDITFNNTYIEYPSEGNPVPTVENPVLRVGVFRARETPREVRQWDYEVFAYQIMKDIPMPIITPAGGEVEKGTEVEITLAEAAEGAKIYYTLDGNEPTKESSEYTEKIVINETLTLKAIAIKVGDDKDLVSNVAEAEYTVIGEEPVVIDTIIFTFKPAPGEVEDSTKVTIEFSRELGEDEVVFFAMFANKTAADTCADEDMLEMIKAYGEPEEDDETVGYPVITKAAPVLKVGYINSVDEEGNLTYAWVVAEYTVKEQQGGNDTTANAGKELAGVSIYPNPSEGEFNVVAPANAQVEIINTSGMLVKRMVVPEGKAQVRLNNSGIYFVRVSANGQIAIKKVVIR